MNVQLVLLIQDTLSRQRRKRHAAAAHGHVWVGAFAANRQWSAA
jgi:hypothetical protein